MDSLMNISSSRLISSEVANPVIGGLIHQKGERITNWGTTWKIVHITPKRVDVVLDSLWFPVFENTAFGRVANGEDKNRLEWLKECEAAAKGKRKASFWKTGKKVGEQHVSTVIVF